jgi:hypothetical protein
LIRPLAGHWWLTEPVAVSKIFPLTLDPTDPRGSAWIRVDPFKLRHRSQPEALPFPEKPDRIANRDG